MEELPPPLVANVTIATGAGFGIRAAARLIDTFYGLVISLFGGFLAGIILVLLDQTEFARPGWQERLGGVDLASWGFSLLGALIYQWVTEGLYGASLGKLCCALRVVTETGEPVGFMQAFKRSLAYYWDSLFFGLVAYSAMKKSELNQRYGDRWAKTVVVKSRDVPIQSKRSPVMFVLAFAVGSLAKTICLAIGLIIHAW